jgi:hypothetical protein
MLSHEAEATDAKVGLGALAHHLSSRMSALAAGAEDGPNSGNP